MILSVSTRNEIVNILCEIDNLTKEVKEIVNLEIKTYELTKKLYEKQNEKDSSILRGGNTHEC